MRAIANLAFIICILASSIYAADQPSCCHLCGQKVCSLEVSRVPQAITRFEVEGKEICIPPICLPWDNLKVRRGGGIRKICVLKEVKQEEDANQYNWSIKAICTTCCRRHGLPCGAPDTAAIQRDPRVPFPYYAVKPAEPTQTQPIIDSQLQLPQPVPAVPGTNVMRLVGEQRLLPVHD